MYRAPVEEILHTLNHVSGLEAMIEKGLMGELSVDVAEAILNEAARFSNDEIAPLCRRGDEIGSKLVDGKVQTPPGWEQAYRQWHQGGWNSLTGPTAYGGQGLPSLMSVATIEMWNGASMAFGLIPLLNLGAVDAVAAHGSEALKSVYLEKMVSGEWTGTMNLTEPHSGSYLAALKSRAEPVGDGSYRIFGQKIFITYGEHELTDNICHLVLARLPDAPAGSRGISLFLVPKFLVNEDGSLGERNDVFCQSLEHKLGIHASPTCVMVYGDGKYGKEAGAIGYLVGEENKGLACMFTMMNAARLNVGIQGVAVGEAAYQAAKAYAKERTQGFAPGYEGEGMAPIIHHPDVARTLLSMKSMVNAARSICYYCALTTDMAEIEHSASNPEESKKWQALTALLTPIAKSYSSDAGVEVASMGIQVHGGMGFIEETGAAQFYRDARIAPIYEGTNGIQAIDLVVRKLPLEGGAVVKGYFDDLSNIVDTVRKSNLPEFEECATMLNTALSDLRLATDDLLEKLASGAMEDALAVATPYQRMFGTTIGAIYLAKAGLPDHAAQQRNLATYFAHNHLSETTALKQTVLGGSKSLAAASEMLHG